MWRPANYSSTGIQSDERAVEAVVEDVHQVLMANPLCYQVLRCQSYRRRKRKMKSYLKPVGLAMLLLFTRLPISGAGKLWPSPA